MLLVLEKHAHPKRWAWHAARIHELFPDLLKSSFRLSIRRSSNLLPLRSGCSSASRGSFSAALISTP
jgi:hypothetical protein